MPSMNRRTVLAVSGSALVAASGCTGQDSSSNPAHWVTVYLGERDETHEVTVRVQNKGGDTLFEKEYALSDNNEADEDAPFDASTEPETVLVTVDGTQFERDWPGFEQSELPCNDGTQAGIEIWVESDENGSPTIRLEPGCQSVTMDE